MNEIPFKLKKDEDDGSVEILVDGMFNGREYTFIQDTGSSRTKVKMDDYLGSFDSLGENQGNGVFLSIREQKIVIPQISVGPLVKKDFVVYRTSESKENTRNLIGMDFLKNNAYQFNFNNRD